MLKKLLFFIIVLYLFRPGYTQSFIMGGDLSYVNSVLSNGGVYRDADSNQVDPYFLFADQGANMVRMRLWHTPENITGDCGSPIKANNLEDVILAFKRSKAVGMQLKLAFHYGDYFNDPGWQKVPKAWEGLSDSILLDSVYNYTYSVLTKLEAEGVVPDIVAIGNETTWGFLTESGTTDGWHWPHDADKFNTGLNAVDDFNGAYGASIKKALHFTDKNTTWLVDLFQDNNVTNYDIIGVSFYPKWTDFNSIQELGNMISQLKVDYDKEVMIFETGAPWTVDNADAYSNFMNDYGNLDYQISPQGQKDFLYDLASIVYESGGSGILYWEPAWISSEMCDLWGQGSSYENVSFFDFTNGNSALPVFEVFDFLNPPQFNRSINVSDEILVYPNPVTDVLKIAGADNGTEIQITDITGHRVKKIFVSNYEIKLYDLPRGIYFVSIIFNNNVVTEKIIKK